MAAFVIPSNAKQRILRSWIRLSGVCVSVLILLCTNSGCQTSTDRIILEHADTLRSSGYLKTLIGNVRIRRGETVITADNALHDSKSGYLDLKGNVKLSEPERTVNAEQISYFEKTGNFEAVDKVDFMQVDSIRIRSRFARYIDTENALELYDDIIIDFMSDGSQVTGQRGSWLEDEEIAIIEGNPVYRLPDPDSDPPDTLVIISRRLAIDQRNNSALFTGNVELTARDVLTISDTLFYQPDSNLTVLSGAPFVWRGTDELSGRKIDLHFENRELRSIFVTGEALALSQSMPGSEFYNKLAGESMTIILNSDDTRSVKVVGDAEGHYHIWDEDDKYKGMNVSAADKIELFIVGDKTTEILLDGDSAGTFYPPELIPEGTTTLRKHLTAGD